MPQSPSEPTPKAIRAALAYPYTMIGLLVLTFVGAYSMYIGYFTGH
jgi:hypothetical protein